ncbi:MAG: hypothetical protein F6K42_13670 [Leptolyngbya sp. SIO1D8]|nr:hypothetical protein [Leptolyngbya sp. SIO1D8]
MTVLDSATIIFLTNVLNAYINSYGEAETSARAIAGAILSVQLKAGALILQGLEMEAWVDELVRNFDPSHLAEQAWSEGEKAIATQAKRWRETLEIKTRATLDAYIQNHTPNLDTAKLQAIVTTILPIVEDVQISRDEAKRLIQLISHEFDWQSAAKRVVDPKWVILADKVAQSVRNQDVEATVHATVQAYVAKFKPSLVDVGESLIESALTAVTNSKANLGLDLALDPETQRLIVKQVSLKLKLMEASPTASKTILEIAQQLHDEVTRYRQVHSLDKVDYIKATTQEHDGFNNSEIGGEMSIGIEIQPSTSDQQKSNEASETPKN